MKRISRHFRIYILRGIFACIPVGLTYFVIKFFYIVIDQKVVNLVDNFIGFRIPGLGIFVLCIVLYVIGYLTSNILGKKFFAFIERIVDRIPIIKTTYRIGKQLSSTLSLSEKTVFKKTVLVDYFRPGVWAVGFVTGRMLDRNTGEKLFKVFLPTVPNPTSGILIILKETQVIDPRWSIEDGMKAIISGGLIGPEEIIVEPGAASS